MNFYIPQPRCLPERIAKLLVAGPLTFPQIRDALPSYSVRRLGGALDYMVSRCLTNTPGGYVLSEPVRRHYEQIEPEQIVNTEVVSSPYTKPFTPLDIAKTPWLSRALNPQLRQDFSLVALASNVPANSLEW